MYDLKYDFHIHSCLSPCGDDEMTPANIAGMAAIKGLDAIALTDHNSCKNCKAMQEAASQYGIMLIPGMEINTVEEVHAVCLFCDIEHALKFDDYVYSKLVKIKNKPEIFGNQIIYNANDEKAGEEEFLLINVADIRFDELTKLVLKYGGVMFPAHIDKSSNSLLSNLGFIPPDAEFKTVEIYDDSKREELLQIHKYLQNCNVLNNSDAHYLENISEPVHSLQVEEKSIECILKYIKGTL